MILLAPGGAVLAADATSAEGIPVGKWIFSPAVESLWQKENNLFLSSAAPVPATSYLVRPHFNWTLPFRDSQFKARYSPQLRRFIDRDEGTQDLEDRYSSHFLEVDLDLKFSNRVNVKVHDEYTLDTLETALFDAGQEIVFNSDPYRKNLGELEVLVPLGFRHNVGLRAVTERLTFDESDAPIFLNYNHDRAALLHEFRLTPLWRLRASVHLGRGEQERPPTPPFEEVEAFRSTDFRLAVQGAVGSHGLLDARLGFLRWDFDNPTLEDYSGLTGEVRYRLNLSERAYLSFTGTQVALPSFFNLNSHYVTRVFEVRWVGGEDRGLFYLASAAYRANDYPVAVNGERREDALWRAEGGVGYKFNSLLKLEGRFRHEERSSNFENLEFNSNRFLALVSWGWI
jgi:hypothetical protein